MCRSPEQLTSIVANVATLVASTSRQQHFVGKVSCRERRAFVSHSFQSILCRGPARNLAHHQMKVSIDGWVAFKLQAVAIRVEKSIVQIILSSRIFSFFFFSFFQGRPVEKGSKSEPESEMRKAQQREQREPKSRDDGRETHTSIGNQQQAFRSP